MTLRANADLLDSETDRIAARISRIERMLVRRHTDERHDMKQAERDVLTMELEELKRRVGR